MVLSGSLADFSLADVLQLLMQQKKSGTLSLVQGRQTAELSLSQGNVTGVRLAGSTPEDTVSEMLLEKGRVEAEEFSNLKKVSEEMGRHVLAALAAKGYLTEAERAGWVALMAEDMVCDLFGWNQGTYSFSTQVKGGAPTSAVNLSTEFACMEGMRRIDEWPRLKEMVPSEKVGFRRTEKEPEPGELGPEALLLEAFGEGKPLQKAAREVPFGPFRLRESVVALWNAGFIEPLEDIKLDAEAPAPVDVQSQKEQKTAMVLGIAAMVFLLAALFRFMMLGLQVAPGGGRAVVAENAQRRDNVETFLWERVLTEGSLPRGLSRVAKDGGLGRGELKGVGGKRFSYKRLGPFEYQLR